MPLAPGSRLDAYELVARIGSGGMGEVWLARDLKLSRKVALKVLPQDLTQDPSRVARLQQEARAASALNHPNVCTIYALGETPDGQQFIAMEFVEGETLRHRHGDRAFSLREALDVAVQIASALGAAHAAGVVHRDMKPENVMVRLDGLVKVLDFGLAKLAPLGSERDAALTTRAAVRTGPGAVVGTVDYMSPEQARGETVDPRTDVWSLGVLLYELIAGRRPFAGRSSSEVLAGILEHEPAPLARFDADAPSELQRIVGKTLRKDKEQRYQVMKDLLLDLQALRDQVAGQTRSSHNEQQAAEPLTRPTSPPPRAGATPRSPSGAEHAVSRGARRAIVPALIVSALALVAAGWWWAVRTPHTSNAVVPNAAPVQRTLTRLTFGPGLQTDVTWSPDGRFIAYASDKVGNFDIWVQPIGGGDAVQVTRSAAQDTQPDWSLDGNTIVFRSERDGGGLFVVPALGGVERQLTTFGLHPSWSPGSKEILFVDVPAQGVGAWPARLYSLSLEEGIPREILADFFQNGGWYWIARHPDGRISALGSHRRLGFGFFTVGRDGAPVTQSKESPGNPFRTNDPEYFVRRRFHWHPSGSALYFQTESNGIYNLWKVRVDSSSLEWVSAERLTTGPGPDVSASLSRDGTRLAFTTELGSTRLWLFPFDAVRRQLGPGRPLTEDGAMAKLSSLSPDGQSVAYNLRRPGIDRDELWITNVASGTGELVAIDALAPVWSQDGKAIAYHYLRTDGKPMTARAAVRQVGGQERFIGRWVADMFFPADWHKDRGLVGSYGPYPGDQTSLVVWPTTNPEAETPDRVLIAKPKTGLWQARFSPNGRWLSFVASGGERPSGAEIHVATADASSRPERWVRIAADHAFPDKPRWAADGRTLYFLSRRPTSFLNLWGVGFDPEGGTQVGQPYPLTQFDAPTLFISPDAARSEMDVSSRHAVLTMRTTTGSIWMLDNVDR